MSNDDPQTDKEIGRARSYELQSAAESRNEPLAWFDELYRDATGNRERIPWSDAAPRGRLQAWLDDNPGAGRSVLDVGCGLGDNAVLLAEAGYNVTAFDISSAAVDWAARAHADKPISFQQADLFDPPQEWCGAFDLVHETYNLQALPQDRLHDAISSISSLVTRGGRVLVMTRLRAPDDEVEGPPWPLTQDDLNHFMEHGLRQTVLERFDHGNTRLVPHALAEYRRA